MQFFRKLLKNKVGATAIEYGLIAALIAVACVGIMSQLGDTLNNTFTTVDTKLTEGNTKGQ
ncbi:Flp family type IVb pilin [Sphingomonas fennica]|uniref:Flp family type IVb pilin n=1 Tax=Edaphosphingomonas fennica TaxID=114404 RepID=A0A2T4HQN3_9SPHN|nr:Flp family type IVb pilin [Sphingomonas fennica]PTD18107.1 Flp family type IVb pilin [Sphingomonas fennica]